jgi:HTH-type transcriptional regulator/antitoxin HigA
MATSKDLKNIPFAVAHPTEIIKDELKARGMSQKELASRMDMQTSNLSRFLKGENITPAIAAKLEVALDIPAEFWLNLQAQYEVDTKNIALRDEKEREAFNIEKMLTNIINLPELYKRLSINSSLFIQDKLDRLEELMGFKVLSLSSQPFILQRCFKKNEKHETDERNETTWLTLAYIKSRNIKPEKQYLYGNAQKAAEEISKFVHIGGITEKGIQLVLNKYGIAYSVIPKLEKTPIDAASLQMSGYPSIITTHRYNDMSRLIFNILHELGHIQKHMSFEKDSQCSVFISSENDYSRDNKEEREANEFAEDMLIPKETWKKMMSTGTKNLSNQHILKILKKLSSEYSLDFNIVAWRYKYESSRYNLYGIKALPIS